MGGYPMIVFTTILMMIFFRWLYVFGGRDNRRGLAGAISLAVIPFTFWFQRNAFVYFVREFLFLQVGTICFVYCSIKWIQKGAFVRVAGRPRLPSREMQLALPSSGYECLPAWTGGEQMPRNAGRMVVSSKTNLLGSVITPREIGLKRTRWRERKPE